MFIEEGLNVDEVSYGSNFDFYEEMDEGHCSNVCFDLDLSNDSYDSDFHESDNDMEDDHDKIFEVNVDLGIERDMGYVASDLIRGIQVAQDSQISEYSQYGSS